MLDRGLRGEQEAKHINVEYLMEQLLGDFLDGSECVDAGIVDENVEASIGLDSGVNDALRFRFF